MPTHSTMHMLLIPFIYRLFNAEKRKELKALHEAGLYNSDIDPFDKVMGTSQKKRM